MALPKIRWPAGGANNLIFAFEPIRVPGFDRAAEREDALSTGGVKQSILIRKDEFLRLNVTLVPEGTSAAAGELGAWDDFMKNHALDGKEFDFFPDKDQAGFTVYTLEDTTWRPQLQVRGPTRRFEFQVTFRKKV